MKEYPYHRYLGKYFLKRKLNSIHIEPINVCNANCIMCTYSNMKRAKGKMSPQLYRKVIDQCTEMGVKSIFLNFYGEPTLHENFAEFAAYAKEKTSADVNFDTNAIALTPELSKKLITSGTDITISLHGLDRQTYHKIYSVDAYDAVIKNVADLLGIRRELGADNKITIQTMKMDLTYHDDETISKKLRDLFGDEVIQSITSCTGKGGFSWEDHRLEKEAILRTSPCRPLLDHLAVLWNGEVTVCCSDFDGRLAIGNVNEKSLQELWTNEQHRKYQRAHLLGQFDSIPLCATCDA